MYVSLFLGSAAGGFALGGATITGLHGLTHFDALRGEGAPPTLGMYGWLHLVHHRDIPHAVQCAPMERRQGLVEHLRSEKGRGELAWVFTNLATHNRWEAIRRPTMYRTLVVAGTSAAVGLALGGVATALAVSTVAATGYVAGATALMVVYDLEHLWTHTNGPRVSPLHADHHGNQRKNLGMWGWNNWPLSKGHPLLRFTLGEVRRAEALATTFRPGLKKVWDVACAEARGAYQAACGR